MVVLLLLRPLLSRSSSGRVGAGPLRESVPRQRSLLRRGATASIRIMAVLNDLSLRHLRAGEGHMECPLSAMYAAVREEYCSGRRADLC